MVRTFFVSRPNFDDGTFYMHEYSRELIQHAENEGLKIVDVKGKDVNAKNVIGRLEILKPTIVCLNGHGNAHEYCGHDMRTVINAETAHALKETMTFVRACNCLEDLGTHAVQKGCNAFIGYSVEFLIPISDQYAARPLSDPVAQPVMETSNEVVKKLIDGRTPQEAVTASKKMTNELVKKLLYSKEFAQDLQSRPAVFALVNNASGLGLKTG